MSVHVEWFVGEKVSHHDFTTDKGLKGKCRKHVETEAETSNIDHGIVRRKVVENVAESFIAKGKETTESHDETCQHGDTGGVVSDAGEVVDCRCFEGSIDQE